jgi:hypothetical protein
MEPRKEAISDAPPRDKPRPPEGAFATWWEMILASLGGIALILLLMELLEGLTALGY